MTRVLVLAVSWIVGSSGAWSADEPIPLAKEKTTVLRVGQMAELQLPADRRYSHFQGDVAGNAIILIRRSGRRLLYRAVQVGRSTIVVSPEVPRGECVSCATLHYFIRVNQ